MTLGTKRSFGRHGPRLLAVPLLVLLAAPALAQTRMIDDASGPYGSRAGVERRQAGEALPEAAREVRDRLARDAADARAEFDRRVERQREAAAGQLRTLAELYAATGRPADAAAVRGEVERILGHAATPAAADGTPAVPAPRAPVPAVTNFVAFRGCAGRAFPFVVTGTTGGAVWGTGAYTDDSSPGAAAVHAGLARTGEQRAVLIRFSAGQDAYTPSSRNGVESRAWGRWDGTFTLEPLPAPKGRGDGPVPYLDTPNGLIAALRGSAGAVILAQVTGAATGTVWGDGVYTDDSPLAVAAVHAGALRDGETGIVRVAVRPPRAAYAGAARNGVASRPYGAFDGSYEILPPPTAGDGAAPAPAAAAALPPVPELGGLRDRVGAVLHVRLTGSATAGVVWGTDAYTDDSSLAAAAVHAGALADGETGVVRVTVGAARPAYEGSTRNGVASDAYGPWGGTFRVERVPAGFVPSTVYCGPPAAPAATSPELGRGGGGVGTTPEDDAAARSLRVR